MKTETKVIYVIDSLRELCEKSERGLVNVGDVLNGYVFMDGRWVDVRLDCDNYTEDNMTTGDKFAELITDYLWKRENENKQTAFSNIKWGRVHNKTARLLNRLKIHMSESGAFDVRYESGQDGIAEERIVRKLLLNKR